MSDFPNPRGAHEIDATQYPVFTLAMPATLIATQVLRLCVTPALG
jgi:hypothetical protein